MPVSAAHREAVVRSRSAASRAGSLESFTAQPGADAQLTAIASVFLEGPNGIPRVAEADVFGSNRWRPSWAPQEGLTLVRLRARSRSVEACPGPWSDQAPSPVSRRHGRCTWRPTALAACGTAGFCSGPAFRRARAGQSGRPWKKPRSCPPIGWRRSAGARRRATCPPACHSWPEGLVQQARIGLDRASPVVVRLLTEGVLLLLTGVTAMTWQRQQWLP